MTGPLQQLALVGAAGPITIQAGPAQPRAVAAGSCPAIRPSLRVMEAARPQQPVFHRLPLTRHLSASLRCRGPAHSCAR